MSADRQALVQALGEAMQAYQRSTQAFDDAVGRLLRLNPADLRCLDWLTGGPMTARELSRATGLSAAATTSLVDRLEQKGFVRRTRGETDRRQVFVELTDQGGARLGELWGPMVAEGNELLTSFSDAELRSMRGHLDAIRELTDRHAQRISAAGSGES